MNVIGIWCSNELESEQPGSKKQASQGTSIASAKSQNKSLDQAEHG